VRSFRAAALSAPVEDGEEDVLEDDGEEEREVSIQPLEGFILTCSDLSTFRQISVTY
jgi:immunoglobulin-binding protein 1